MRKYTVSSFILSVLAVWTFSGIWISPVDSQIKDELPWEAGTRITVDISQVEYVDGDTIRYQEHSIRFLGCDTPEKSCGFFDGDQEPYATRAENFTRNQIEDAEEVELEILAERDRYGRLLGHIFVDDTSLSLLLVQERLAYETISRYGDNGYPEIAEAILEATGYEFYNPHEWREQHRR